MLIAVYYFLNLPCLCIGCVFFGYWCMKSMKGQEGMMIDSSWIQYEVWVVLDSNTVMSNVWSWC